MPNRGAAYEVSSFGRRCFAGAATHKRSLVYITIECIVSTGRAAPMVCDRTVVPQSSTMEDWFRKRSFLNQNYSEREAFGAPVPSAEPAGNLTTASACLTRPFGAPRSACDRDEWGTRSHALAVVRFPAGGTRNIRFVLTAFDRIRPNALPNRAAKFQI